MEEPSISYLMKGCISYIGRSYTKDSIMCKMLWDSAKFSGISILLTLPLRCRLRFPLAIGMGIAFGLNFAELKSIHNDLFQCSSEEKKI